jgi:FixJ family two-component response regulator
VSVVDDDALVLRSVGRLLQSAGYAVRTFASSQDFLECYGSAGANCVVMDLSMPGLDGLELQQALTKRADAPPVVFISG